MYYFYKLVERYWSMMQYLFRIYFEKELNELENRRQTLYEYSQWLSEFTEVRIVLDNMIKLFDPNTTHLTMGRVSNCDEIPYCTFTVQALRDQLRYIKNDKVYAHKEFNAKRLEIIARLKKMKIDSNSSVDLSIVENDPELNMKLVYSVAKEMGYEIDVVYREKTK